VRRAWLILSLLLIITTPPAWAAGWNIKFKANVFDAAYRWLPAGLQNKLPAPSEGWPAIAERAVAISQSSPKTPQERYEAIKQMLADEKVDTSRVWLEMAVLAAYFMDNNGPQVTAAFYAKMDQSPLLAQACFSGYYEISDLSRLLQFTQEFTSRRLKDIQEKAGVPSAENDVLMANDLVGLFNLFVNLTANLWSSAARAVGRDLGAGKPEGLLIKPSDQGSPAGALRPDPNFDLQADGQQLIQAGKSKGIFTDLALARDNGNPGGDDIVFTDGATVSGSQAKNKAQQLANSNVQVNSGGVDKLKGLDEKAVAALQRLGIDISASRPAYNGTRGGVAPGQIVRVGDLDFIFNNISSVEVGSHATQKVYMQMSDTALGTGQGSGRLNQKVVGAVIQANVGAFKTCFERRLRDKPDLAGRVFVQFVISADGSVSEVSLLENTTGDEPFADCLSKQVRRLRFPPPEGGDVTFVFPFIFEQAYNF